MPTIEQVTTTGVVNPPSWAQSRSLVRTSDGTAWLFTIRGSTAGTRYLAISRSSNGGASFDSTETLLDKVAEITAFVDQDDAFHLLFKTDAVVAGGRAADSVYYMRVTPDAAMSGLTLSAPVLLVTEATSRIGDIVACRRPGSDPTTWDAFVTYLSQHNRIGAYSAWGWTLCYRRIPVGADGTAGTPTNDGLADDVVIDQNGADPFATLDFHHTGDAKTVKDGAPHIFLSYNRGPGGAYYPTNVDPWLWVRKAAYAGGAWTWSSAVQLDDEHYVDFRQWMNTLWDGERLHVVGSTQNWTQYSYDMIRYEVDVDTLAVTRNVLISDPNGSTGGYSLDPEWITYNGSATYDGDGNLYIYTQIGADRIRLWKWTRATGLLTVVRDTDPGLNNEDCRVSVTRGTPGNCVEATYRRQTTGTIDIAYDKGFVFQPIDTVHVATGESYDYAIGGLPFLSAASAEAAHRRETAPYRKDQFDQSNEAGEQSLSFWWSRSQTSFHSGAGQRFLDGGDNDPFRTTRFDYSRNVDVWTPGEVKALPPMSGVVTGSAYQVLPGDSVGGFWFTGSVDGVWGLYHRSWNATITAATTLGVTGSVGTAAHNGVSIFVLTDAGVWKANLYVGYGTPGAFTKIYDAPPTASAMYLYWLKGRLIASNAGKLYELDPAPGTTQPWPAAFYTHPMDGQTFYLKGAAEGPSGFYLAARARNRGSILFVGIAEVSGVPTLSAPVEVLALPDGDELWDTAFCLASYLGKYLLIASYLGVRVCTIGPDGSLDAGTLTLDPGNNYPDSTSGWYFGGFTVQDRFAYVACKGMSPGQGGGGAEVAAIRIDLSQEIADGRFAWAQDQTTTDRDLFPVTCTMNYDGRLLIAGDSSATAGIWGTTATGGRALDGYLVTSRIRFSTAEDKVFERLQVTGEGTSGAVSAIPFLNGEVGTNYPAAVLSGPGTQSAETRIDDQFTGKQGPFIQVKLAITGADAYLVAQAKLRSYHLKALPAQKRQRVEQIPVLLYDLEKDRTGQQRGEIGSAYTRLAALEALEEAGSVVTLQRFGPNFTAANDRLCVVDRVEFVSTAKPTDVGSGWGGIAMITVRMVD